ncbi:MAG TPA: threonine-phosphate decarboxylase CobD [Methylocystis sp.]|nr:threonine-phosphate decarboxylase CobD [Methylocystis sp.]
MSLAERYVASPPPERIVHGGGLDAARRRFPDAPTPWLDLSTGVSPRAYPIPAIAPEAFARLPDESAVAAAEAAAAAAYGTPPQVAVVAGAGSQAFIKCLPRLFLARRVATLGLAYAEHAAAWRAAGARAFEAQSLDDLAGADVAIVVNPNNPDGRLCLPQALTQLARRMAPGGVLIVDEAFMDFSPQMSVAADAGTRLVVLRSFGKAYGLPGLRLGFALCDAALAERLRMELGPWSVSGPALAVGAAALADAAWLAESAKVMQGAAGRLDALLRRAGFSIVGGAPLFRLAQSEKAEAWFHRLCASGILTRRFPERPQWLRFGLPGAHQDFARLAQALGVCDV